MSSDPVSDRSYIESNRTQRERLATLVDRLSNEELARPVGDDWTVGATLAHLAYWDIRGVGALEAAVTHGLPLTFWDAAEGEHTNQVLTPAWLAIPPREAAERAIKAAEAVDGLIERLPEEIVPVIARVRYRMLERGLHRRAHLDEVEQALANGAR